MRVFRIDGRSGVARLIGGLQGRAKFRVGEDGPSIVADSGDVGGPAQDGLRFRASGGRPSGKR